MPNEARAGKIVIGLVVAGGCAMLLALVLAGMLPEQTVLVTVMRFVGAGLTVTGFLLWFRYPYLLSRWADEDDDPTEPDPAPER